MNAAIAHQHDAINAFGRCVDCGGPMFGTGVWIGFDELVTTYDETDEGTEVTQTAPNGVVVAKAYVEKAAHDPLTDTPMPGERAANGDIIDPVHSKEFVTLPGEDGLPVQHERKRLVHDWKHITL